MLIQKKTILIPLLILFPFLIMAQTIDTAAIEQQVDSLIQVSRTLTHQGNYDEALDINAKAEKLVQDFLGQETASYGSTCFNHGRVLHFKGDLQNAEKWYLEAKAIRERTIGKENPDYAGSLMNLGNLYSSKGQYEKAERLHLEAKSILKKTLGEEHRFYYIFSLRNLTDLYKKTGRFEKAEAMLLESESIQKKITGEEHPDYANSLNELAYLYEDIEQYKNAEHYYLEAKNILKKTVEEEAPSYIRTLNNLVFMYVKTGQYKKGEQLALETLASREKTLGKDHPDYAYFQVMLGQLLTHMGQYEKAEALYLDVKSFYEKTMGKESLDYAVTLNQLAIVYWKSVQFEKAEALYIEAKSILERTVGTEHFNYIATIGNLAIVTMQMGQYEKAEALFLETLMLNEKTKGKEHSDYADVLNNLGFLYLSTEQFEKAKPLYSEAQSILEKTIGEETSEYINVLINQGILHREIGQYDKAAFYYEEVARLDQKLINSAIQYLSEQELKSFVEDWHQRKSGVLTFADLAHSKNKRSAEICYNNSLFYKGFLLQAYNQVKTLAQSDPDATEKFNQLKSYQGRLAVEYSKPTSEQRDVEELEEKINVLEKELASAVASLGELRQKVTWQEVQGKLKPEEAAIEFVHFDKSWKAYSDYNFIYAALVLRPDQEHPQYVPLFDEHLIDSLLKVSSGRKADYVNELYTLADRGASALKNPKRTLYELIWKPLEESLTGAKTIYFSPAGSLHRINLGAIPINDFETLADHYRFVALNSTRQLVSSDAIKSNNNNAVLFGGIEYERDTTSLAEELLLASRSADSFSFNTVDSTLRGNNWKYLPGTAREVKALENIMKEAGMTVQVKRSYEATETSFKNLGTGNAIPSKSPKVLHVATHGYFFPDPIGDNESKSGEPIFQVSENPMLRSGLILAGGNSTWQGQQPSEGQEDGIITAYEISQINLSNTELVVLSACETGLGDIDGNEGVYGLQRAFKIAGVKYLIMSLWQVPDKQTSLLMRTFYEKWLEEKMDIPSAFHAAQQEMREMGFDPYQWAGFVLLE